MNTPTHDHPSVTTGPTESAYPARYWHRLDDGRIAVRPLPAASAGCARASAGSASCATRQRRPHGAHHLRPFLGLLHRPDREEAAQPLLPRHQRAVVRHRRLQPRLPVLPELGHLQGRARWDRLDATRPRRTRSPGPPCRWRCRCVAFTYNDPVIFAEYAIDTARACHELGLNTVAVTAGTSPRRPAPTSSPPWTPPTSTSRASPTTSTGTSPAPHLRPVLDTLRLPAAPTPTSGWRLTTLLIPGHNDSDAETRRRCAAGSSPSSAPTCLSTSPPFTPTSRCSTSRPRRPRPWSAPATLALAEGLHFVYTGNVDHRAGEITSCAGCGASLIERDRYAIRSYSLTAQGACPRCGTMLPGRFGSHADDFGPRRIPVSIGS